MAHHSSTSSPLLHCLDQLDDGVWEQVMLPKLLDQGSAGAVTLTCTQLRRLCQHSMNVLNLEQLPNSSTSPEQLASQAAAVAAHFPNCRVVRLSAQDSTCYQQLPGVLPLLSR